MRIAHVTATFPPYYSGTGMVCYYNALELARRGHAVTVFTAAHPAGEYEYPREITVRRLPVLFRFGNAPVLPGLLAIREFDLIHLHFPFYSGAELATMAAIRRRMPMVITYHQDVLLQGVPGLIAGAYRQTVSRWVLGSAARVLFTSLDYARASHARWLFATRPHHVGELPNGVDVSRFHPGLASAVVRNRYGFSPDDVLLILVAALDRAHYFKGTELLLRALKQVAARTVKALIVGDGDLRERYRAQAVALGLAERVVFAGRVSDDELPLHYAAADCGVLPSWTMGEAFGLVLLEAMACGKPVIASNLPGVRTVVSDGEDGLLVRPGDVDDLAEKIRMLLDDPQRRREMGKRGRAKVEVKYAWPKVADRLEKVYEALVSEATCRSCAPAEALDR